jgi:hypothetical protein
VATHARGYGQTHQSAAPTRTEMVGRRALREPRAPVDPDMGERAQTLGAKEFNRDVQSP